MKHKIVPVAAGFVMALAGCGGSAVHHAQAHTAAAACRNFESWFHAQPGGNLASGEFAGTLTSAVKEAPRGTLHADLEMLQSDVGSAEAAHGGSGGQPEQDYTVSDASVVEQICQP